MVEVLGARVHVAERGSGPPLLLLHGNPDSSALWDGVVDALAPRWRCIAPDLPGYGRSTAPDDFDYSLEGQARFVAALIDALGLAGQPLAVAGHDFGGIFAMAWLAGPGLAQNPQVKLVLGNTAFSPDYRWHLWARIWRRRGLGELSMRLMNRFGFRRVIQRGSPALPHAAIDATYALLTPAVRRSILRLYRAVQPEHFAAWEPRLLQAARQAPIGVVWGEADPYIAPAFADRMGARRVVRVAGAGHWLPLEQPQRFAQELERFLIG